MVAIMVTRPSIVAIRRKKEYKRRKVVGNNAQCCYGEDERCGDEDKNKKTSNN